MKTKVCDPEKRKKPTAVRRWVEWTITWLGFFEFVELVDDQVQEKLQEKLLLAFRKEGNVKDLVDFVSDFFGQIRVELRSEISHDDYMLDVNPAPPVTLSMYPFSIAAAMFMMSEPTVNRSA